MKEIATGIDVLREIALDQHGYVTTRQAQKEGLSKSAISMLVKRSRLQHVAHGVYRVPQVPSTHFDRFMLAVLWTGVPEACLSHDTALDAYEVSDISPTSIHLTVAKKRRITRRGGKGYVLHYQDVDAKDVIWWEGIPIVRLRVAVEQCINGGAPTYLVRQAVERSAAKGRISQDEAERFIEMIDKRNAG
jgi:predicted transcriptional regulator of viral defense system